jgi:hemerythrin
MNSETNFGVKAEDIDRRDHKLEQRFIQLLEQHSREEERVIKDLQYQLSELKQSNDNLVASTREIIEAYDTTQKAIKVSIGFGKFIKFIAGILVAFYALMNYLQHDQP